MKPIITIISLVILNTSLLRAQSEIQGIVLSKSKGKPLSYISIKINNQQVNTLTDTLGQFKLLLKQTALSDTIRFTAVGYKTKEIVLSQLPKNGKVFLEDDNVMLSEVNVKNRKYKRKTLEPFLTDQLSELRYRYYGRPQIARRFDVADEYSRLEQVKIARVINKNNKNTSAIFRLRVYDSDPISGLPCADICHEVIEVSDNNKTLIDVDLKKYDITIPGKSFFIAIEWIMTPLNEMYDEFHVFKEGLLISQSDQSPQFASYIIGYQPIIYMVPVRQNQKQLNTFVLNFKGEWISPLKLGFPDRIGEAAITPTVSY
jgi:hypothetical protein